MVDMNVEITEDGLSATFENNPQEAIKAFWEQSGILRFENTSTESLTEKIRSQIIDQETTDRLVEGYNSYMSPNEVFQGCGLCGRRVVGESGKELQNIADLSWLQGLETPCDNSIYFPSKCGAKLPFYPQFVRDVEGKEVTTVCECCLKFVRKKAVPELSLAAGIDFGFCALEPLNIIEKAVISKSLIYSKVIKLRPSSSTTVESSQSAIKGHVISIPHESVETVAQELPNLIVPIQIVFIGKTREWDFVKNKFINQNTVRPNVVFRWLKFLKKNNQLYKDISINENHDVAVGLEGIVKNLAENVIISEDNVLNLLETQTEGEVLVSQGTCKGGLEHVLLSNSISTSNRDSLILQALDPIKIKLKNTELKNEFLENEIIHLESFPWLFLLGKGIPSISPRNNSHMEYLFNFHDNRFGKDLDFLFFCFNQKQRWQAANSVSVKVKSDPCSIQKFNNIVNDPEFDEKLKRGINDPESQEAKEIVKNLSSIIRVVGSKVEFGPCEREATLSKLYGYFHFFGYPSVFFTMTPSDADQILTFRISDGLPQNDPRGYSFSLPSLKERYQILSQNPVAAAKVFHRIKAAFFEKVFGLPLSSSSRKSTRVSNRKNGCFGSPVAFFGVDECQGRGSLHMHALLWGGIPPNVIQYISDKEELLKEAVEAIDSMFRASVSTETHTWNAERMANNELSERYSLNICPRPSTSPKEYEDRFSRVAISCNNHKHHLTCRKGKSGKYGCRSFIPSPITKESGPVELEYEQMKGRISNVSPKATISPFPERGTLSYHSQPLPIQDRRIISFDLKRPTVEDTTLIPYSPVCSAVLSCNVAAHPVLNSCIAQAIAFYTLKYMTKDAVALVNTLSCLKEAKRVVMSSTTQSKADDAGSPLRLTKHLMTRLINNLETKIEVSAQMAASSIQGLSSISASHETWFCFPWPLLKTHDFVPGPCEETFDSRENDANLDEATTEIEEDEVNEERIEEFSMRGEQSFTEIIVDSDNQLHVVPQHIHYLHRGPFLKNLSLYEYTGIIKICPITQSLRTTEYGRKGNRTFQFEEGHPLRSQLTQRLRSKFFIPILSGVPPPKHPGVRKATEAWRKQSQNWAAYIITTFVPWINGEPPIATYDELCDVLKAWNENECVIGKARYQCVVNVSRCLITNSKTKAVISAWRGRSRKLWDSSTRFPNEYQGEEGAEQDVIEFVRQEIMDDDIQQAVDEQTSNYIQASIRELGNCLQSMNQIEVEEESFNDEIFSIKNANECLLIHHNIMINTNVIDNTSHQRRIVGGNYSRPENTEPNFNDLNSSQKMIVVKVQEWEIKRRSYHNDPSHFPFPDPLKIIVHGGPGTGKSFLMKFINGIVGEKRVINAAPTGIVAAAMNRGRTLNSLFSIPVLKKKGHRKDTRLKPLDQCILSNIREAMSDVWMLVIDEVSMMDAVMLSHINQRLQEALQNFLPFGGLSVILCGDFQQLPPTTGSPLFCAALDENTDLGKPSGVGIELFKTFRKMDLTIQERASGDPLHVGRIEEMRRSGVIPRSLLYNIKPLTSEDILGDPGWSTAPIVVTSNMERIAINLMKAVEFAKRNRTCVLRWENPIYPSFASSLSSGTILRAREECPDLHFIFVKGASCFLSTNINPSKGLANGTPAKMESITYNDDEAEQRVRVLIENHRNGEIIDVPTPFCVNIDVNHLRGEWDEAMSINSDKVVIPVLMIERFPERTKWGKIEIPFYRFPITLGFAITFHKVQGKTLDRIILCLNERKGKKMPNITFTSFLVGYSRVTLGQNIRRLGASGNALEYLTKLKEDPRFRRWMSSFDQNGTFNITLESVPKKRTLKDVYTVIQGQNWESLNAHPTTIRRWRLKLNSIDNIGEELEEFGEMDFALFMRKRFKRQGD